MTKCINRLSVVLLSLSLLSACGGGSSSAPAAAPPPPVDTQLDWDQGNWDQEDWQ